MSDNITEVMKRYAAGCSIAGCLAADIPPLCESLAAKDAEIAKLRAEVEAAKAALGCGMGHGLDAGASLAERIEAREAAHKADLAHLRAIEAAAAAFLPAHDQATFDMKPVYGCAFAHGVQFVGEGYGDELEALRAALIKAVKP